MRNDVPWCKGVGQAPVAGTVSDPYPGACKPRGRCPECSRRLSCPNGTMAPHAWSPMYRSERQAYVEDR